MIAAIANVQLSQNFTLGELVVSEEATRRGIDNQPSPQALDQLKRLCTLVLQPLRDDLGTPIVVNSGYRSPVVNRMVGGAANSLHMQGRAADIVVPGMTVRAVCKRIFDLGLPIDELIAEGSWSHVAVALDPRHQARRIMTAHFSPSGVSYTNGIAWS